MRALLPRQRLSPDAFFIFDSVRNQAGDIVDFRFVYVNARREVAEEAAGEAAAAGHVRALPRNRTSGMFDKYRKVVSGPASL
jgi:hypothetical protein